MGRRPILLTIIGKKGEKLHIYDEKLAEKILSQYTETGAFYPRGTSFLIPGKKEEEGSE